MKDKSLLYSWAAGFLDGEGCFTLSKFYRKDVRNDIWAAIQCAMADIPRNTKALEILKKLFGGYLAHYPVRVHNGKQRGVVFWRITSQKANECAKALLPYLTIKKGTAKIIIKYQNSVKDKRWHRGLPRGATMPEEIVAFRQKLIAEIRTLNRETSGIRPNNS